MVFLKKINRKNLFVFALLLVTGTVYTAYIDLKKTTELKTTQKEQEAAFVAFENNKFFLVSQTAATPVIDGVIADQIIVRIKDITKNDNLKTSVFAFLKSIEGNLKFNEISISEIHYDKVNGFTVWLRDGKTSVKLGEHDLKNKTAQVNRVMEYLDQERVRARVIDARFKKKIVVRPRNDT